MIRVLIVLDAFFSSFVNVYWGRVTSLEDPVTMEFLKEFIMKLLLFLHGTFPYGALEVTLDQYFVHW